MFSLSCLENPQGNLGETWGKLGGNLRKLREFSRELERSPFGLLMISDQFLTGVVGLRKV